MAFETPDYVLGHTQKELTRLQRQSAFFREPTIDILRRAGLQEGMRVLDVGCGAGDVSLIAAELVGPNGSVLGIDQSEEPLVAGRARAAAAERPWIKFQCGDVNEYGDASSFDAVIGRFILLHLNNPIETLRRITEQLRPNSIVTFIEMDLSTATAVPGFPLFDNCMGWLVEMYRRSGLEPDMGSRLYGVFRAAGLTPDLSGSARIEAGPGAVAHEYISDTVRSAMPYLDKLGIASPDEIDIETLADRLHTEAVKGDHCFIFPRFIGAWARRPG